MFVGCQYYNFCMHISKETIVRANERTRRELGGLSPDERQAYIFNKIQTSPYGAAVLRGFVEHYRKRYPSYNSCFATLLAELNKRQK